MLVSVLIVGGLPEQRLLTMLLSRAGYSPFEVTDSGEALREIIDGRHEIVILTVEAPPIEGVSFLPVVRRLTDIPMIVIGPDSENEAVQALLQGADVYVRRPIDPDEFLARMTALLRRSRTSKLPGTQSDVMQFSELRNELTDLTPVEARLLDCLLNRQGAIASREDLMLSVWGERGKSSSLRFYVRQLRQKLSNVPLVEILNYRGRGYRLRFKSMDPIITS